MIHESCVGNNTPDGMIDTDVPEGFVSNRKNGLDGPVAELRVVPRGRPPFWVALDGGYAVHPDGRVRDRHRNLVKNPAIIAALVPPKTPPTTWFKLICCGILVRADRPLTAAAHWGDCISDMHNFRPNPKTYPRDLSPDAVYTRDTTERRPRRNLTAGVPWVLVHNGKTGTDRKVRTVSWSAALELLNLHQ